MGMSGCYWENEFNKPPWKFSITALGMHSFDDLFKEPNCKDEVKPHIALLIKKASDELL